MAARAARSFRADESGIRLDAFLARALGCSRAEARRVLAAGDVRVDGRRRGPGAKGEALVAGAEVEIDAWVAPAARRPLAEPGLALRVLAEGDDWLVVDKPAGMPVHPLSADERGTALGAVIARRPEIAGVGEGGLRAGVVHRLDLGTSGVLAFATRESGFARLRAAFREGRMEKVYRAVVCGAPGAGGSLALRMKVARHRPARVAVSADGRPVAMTWRALESLRGATLVEVRPTTGFLHQIRAAFAHLGHPLLGDASYGAAPMEDASLARRHLLHASRLAGVGLAAEAPDAEDFAAALSALRS